eukprot:8590573-Pyramimonas_sp.AAC.1
MALVAVGLARSWPSSRRRRCPARRTPDSPLRESVRPAGARPRRVPRSVPPAASGRPPSPRSAKSECRATSPARTGRA